MHTTHKNDDASVSSLFHLVVGIVFLVFFCLMVFTPIMLNITDAHNTLSTLTPPSEEYQDSMSEIQMVYFAYPIVAVLLFIIGYIAVTLREKRGVV